MAKLNVQPAYNREHDGCPDLDSVIYCKVLDFGGEVDEEHRWSMDVTLPNDKVVEFVCWAMANKHLFRLDDWSGYVLIEVRE